jgi:hypothetical protein
MRELKFNDWSSKRPTKDDAGKWFFVKHDGKNGYKPIVRFKKVRVDKDGELFLCPESDDGIHKETIGTNLRLYKPEFTQFIGPIAVPNP